MSTMYQSEYELEMSLIKKLKTMNYSYVLLENYDGLLSNFRKHLNLLNADNLKGIDLTDKEFERVMLEINNKTIFRSAKKLREKFNITRDDNEPLYLKLIDFDDYSKNKFQVTNQLTIWGKYENRYDVTLLINGLPIIQIELKRRGLDLKEAFNQVNRYKRESFKDLLRYLQIFVVSNGVNTKYCANTPEGPLNYNFAFTWSDEKNNTIDELLDFTPIFLEQKHLLDMINKYMVIAEGAYNEEKNTYKHEIIVMRPYQVYAVNAFLNQILNTNKGGYIWHTTGAGKTLTSWKCANLISTSKEIKKIFFLVDRKDLDTQTTTEFDKFDIKEINMTETTKDLVEKIKNPNEKLIVTTIQKMAKAVQNPKYKDTMDSLKWQRTIFIFDECHRSQFGQMHTDIKRHFGNAQYFGFTGTPRFPANKANKSGEERTTADIFGECLHTYLIKEAIKDHNVLGFCVEYVNTFKKTNKANDGTEVLDINKREALIADERIELVTNHILTNHNVKTQDRKYTAILATDNINMLLKYYDKFKEKKHDLNIAAIYTFQANQEVDNKDNKDEKEEESHKDKLVIIMNDFNEIFKTKHSINSFGNYHTDIASKVKEGKIDILIVVNMFLTGFDSKKLNTLYVDKNLEYHDLLQAFSRTNRVEFNTKPYGNIVCYRNLKQNVDNAIALFSGTEDLDTILLKEYKYYLKQFKQILEKLYEVTPTPASVDKLEGDTSKKKFIIAFRELSKTLFTLKTFLDFSQEEFKKEDNVYGISSQLYEDYKSKYFKLKEEVQRNEVQQTSILNDIDFAVEIMHVDIINVDYILRLLDTINHEDKESREKDVNKIFDELDKTDNPQLKNKKELIKKFLNKMILDKTIEETKDMIILEALEEYLKDSKNKEVIDFAKENDIDLETLINLIKEEEYSEKLTKTEVREKAINRALPFKEKTSLTNKIFDFIKQHIQRFR